MPSSVNRFQSHGRPVSGAARERPPGTPLGSFDALLASKCIALFAATDLEGVIEATFRLLRSAIACDFVGVLYRRPGTGLIRERDSRGRSYTPAFTARHAALNPAIPLALANPGIRLVTSRSALPSSIRALRRTAFYQR